MNPNAHTSNCFNSGVQSCVWQGNGFPMASDEKHLIDAGKAIVMAADEAG